MLTILLLSLAMNSFIKAIGYTIPMDLCARGKLFLENNEWTKTCDFLIPPTRQYFKVNIQRIATLGSSRLKWTKHGYMLLSPPDFHPVIDITIYMDVASNPGPESNCYTQPKSSGLKVL